MKKRPNVIRIGKDDYVATVLMVMEDGPDGTPRVVEVMRDEEAVNLAGGERFWVVYAPKAMRKPRD